MAHCIGNQSNVSRITTTTVGMLDGTTHRTMLSHYNAFSFRLRIIVVVIVVDDSQYDGLVVLNRFCFP